MKNKTIAHLENDKILWAVIDATALIPEDKEHLSLCAQCLNQKEHIEQDLVILGKQVERFTPFSEQAVKIPDGQKSKIINWQIALSGIAGVFLILVSAWAVFLRVSPAKDLAKITNEIWEDSIFMNEVSLLADNPLPEVFTIIAPVPEKEEIIDPQNAASDSLMS